MVKRKKRNPYPYKLVELQWLDASTDHGWENDTEIDISMEPVPTVGFLLYQDERVVVIASTVSEGTSNSRIKIPRGMILSMIELEVKPVEQLIPEPLTEQEDPVLVTLEA